MSDEGSEIGAFMAGFVIGGLVGAATALILAPQSGAETRAQISEKGMEFRSSGEQQLHEYRNKAGDAVTQARTRAHDTSKQVQDQVRIVLDEGKKKDSDSNQLNEEGDTEA